MADAPIFWARSFVFRFIPVLSLHTGLLTSYRLFSLHTGSSHFIPAYITSYRCYNASYRPKKPISSAPDKLHAGACPLFRAEIQHIYFGPHWCWRLRRVSFGDHSSRTEIKPSCYLFHTLSGACLAKVLVNRSVAGFRHTTWVKSCVQAIAETIQDWALAAGGATRMHDAFVGDNSFETGPDIHVRALAHLT
ncbi:hypothetical protein EJF18_10327 [Clavispora lusitaniae]|uniref:Uncharacterized protein n=2 Tax=Clavispora lusitaniae TaxID=36911 RepID=C4XWI7_CLAL4|nr:uncharacterized protein CLUG_00310 [Clavispora lusitaniae ATCC 42720]QFZ25236.1 hypothetical protein EJF14_10327 [Clavispora lusitaniae]EEQ36187.1 predicted protein [Clavispora lusitaniae ATCC 42720]QFZ31461.1 hypothetical protein EJF16_10327 [Clavispora lusitaniae]QFZ37129.1 hypothetical protein EJF15_10327 [Clavispora lusitaniae]QFZ42813.1 hypothetical protein EJF18_10327 [Clavispora lusitaniae]